MSTLILNLPHRAPAILDTDLAEHFGTETKAVNKARSRNPERFPEDFAFQLTRSEIGLLRFQSGTSIKNQLVRGFFERQPWAYTEEGVAMLSGILNTPAAVDASIRIMRLFRETRQELYVARTAMEHLSRQLLLKNPTWKKIVHYKSLGLTHAEIARLLRRNVSTIRRQVRELEACGLLQAPMALPRMQQMTLGFDGGAL